MSAVIAASALGKAYRRTWALRDWAFQWAETGLYLLLALLLAGFCTWRVNRRLIR